MPAGKTRPGLCFRPDEPDQAPGVPTWVVTDLSHRRRDGIFAWQLHLLLKRKPGRIRCLTKGQGSMGRNIEIKARVREPDALRVRVEARADGPVKVLDQEDIFFHAPRGRVKLRTFSDGRGELIAYERPNRPGPTLSSFHIHRTDNPDGLKSFLTEALGVRGVVRKRRLLYQIGQTRVHLDDVEGLGSFLELETVLTDDQSEEEGERIASEILAKLEIPADARVDCAYIDLLEASE